METPKTAQEIHEVLYDGVDLKVKLRDGSERTVKVRKISRGQFAAFANAFGDEEKEAAFYLGPNGALVDQLDEDSFEAVMREGHRLNFTRFSSWFGRQYQRLQVLKETGAMKTALELIDQSPALRKLVESTRN